MALEAQTGELAWETQLADYRDGITHSSGAMIMNGLIVTGRTCSPSSLEARCFVSVYDADTGEEQWRTYTAAGADDPGGQTWGDLPTAKRVHVSPWGLPGSYDPELNRIFWGGSRCRCHIHGLCDGEPGTSVIKHPVNFTQTQLWL